MSNYILAIDQGTTSSRAMVFDSAGAALGLGQQEIEQLYPANGWVEHDPSQIWKTTLHSCRVALDRAGLNAGDIDCIGISNQRETTVIWDRETGEAICNAIVWQDRRTSDYCNTLREQGLEESIQDKTGLLIDPYFSATKIRWMLEHVPGARARAEAGELAFGTIDSFLLWRLTAGQSHCTDATNASRTMLFNIHTQQWDAELLQYFEIPAALLPQVKDCADNFGVCEPQLLGAAIPITGMIGDQQAAAFAQGCFSAGQAKCTYGTGCFLLMNTGPEVIKSNSRLLSTVAYRLKGEACYAIEGSIFMAGATIQWIRDGLKLIDDAAQSEALAMATDDDLSVYLVPAFTGLGAPYWDADARGAIYGLTRDTGIKELVTAALLSVCYQTKDLVLAMEADDVTLRSLRVDGGMANNDYVLQKLSDLLNCKLHRPLLTETTALGAAYVAGLQEGLFSSLEEIAERWQLDRSFQPQQSEQWRDTQYRGWLAAIARTRSKS
jgi:glycerol kinase